MNSKNKFFFFYFIILFIIFYFNFATISYCAYPTLVSTMMRAFEKIKTWLIKLATPAAAVAIGTGVFMRKFSFGDEEKIRTGKKLVKTALFSYVFILGIDLVLSAIQSLI